MHRRYQTVKQKIQKLKLALLLKFLNVRLLMLKPLMMLSLILMKQYWKKLLLEQMPILH
nr:MAG TPA: hypothetical protein [Bacteriophage sp.]